MRDRSMTQLPNMIFDENLDFAAEKYIEITRRTHPAWRKNFRLARSKNVLPVCRQNTRLSAWVNDCTSKRKCGKQTRDK